MTPVATSLPPGLVYYRSTPVFSERTLPAALRWDHATKAGAWGRIRILSGRLRYQVTDASRTPFECELASGDEGGIIEPTIAHRVEPVGPVEFLVEFWRAA